MKQKNMLVYLVIIMVQGKWYKNSYKIFNKDYENNEKNFF